MCGDIETEEHVLFNCDMYTAERTEWEDVRSNEENLDKMECVKGYADMTDRLEQATIMCMGKIWNKRTQIERQRRINAVA